MQRKKQRTLLINERDAEILMEAIRHVDGTAFNTEARFYIDDLVNVTRRLHVFLTKPKVIRVKG